MTDVHDERAVLLRKFLRDQREKWTRQELGLPSHSGAVPTLSQEDLADLTGYALTSVRALEGGKLAHPSPGLLGAVASALRMSPAEREFLWSVAAGARPPATSDHDKMWADDPALKRMIEDAYPDPAFLIDPAFRVQARNRAVAEWFVDFSEHPELEDSIALWMFTNAHAGHVFPDWELEVTPVMIGRIRAMHGLFTDDPLVNGLIDTLCQRSAWARRLWEEDATIVEWPKTRRLRVPGHTDPAQADDVRWQVTANVVFLNPPTDGDERLLVTFLLPQECRTPPAQLSEHACAACDTERSAASPGAA